MRQRTTRRYSAYLPVKFRTLGEHHQKNEMHLPMNVIRNNVVFHLFPTPARELA